MVVRGHFFVSQKDLKSRYKYLNKKKYIIFAKYYKNTRIKVWKKTRINTQDLND